MTSRRVFILALILMLVAVVAWRWFGREEIRPAFPGREVATPAPQSKAIAVPASASVTSSVAPGAPQVRTESAPLNPVAVALPAVALSPPSRPERPAEGRADLEAVQFMLRDFRTRMGENPVGSNAEIMRAVMGGNSAGARLGPPAGQNVNAEGELTDRWGTAYFFHQLSKNSTEIRSAGPDRKMWTDDDLVTK